MLDEVWDDCNLLYDPIADPQHAKMRAAINLTLQTPLARGVANLSEYWVSFGDEIQVALVPSNASSLPLAFERWAAGKQLTLSDIGCEEWAGCYITMEGNLSLARESPARYYYSTLFSHDFGIEAYGMCTKICREFVPRIKTSANFSPGTGAQGNAFQWIRIFRQQAFVSLDRLSPRLCHHTRLTTVVNRRTSGRRTGRGSEMNFRRRGSEIQAAWE